METGIENGFEIGNGKVFGNVIEMTLGRKKIEG